MYQYPISEKVRALADCDSFFASCEIAKNPKLKGKAVCVGRKGDIILAASYQAKRLGVNTGTPAREAEKILGSQAIFVPPNFSLYAKTSKKVFSLLSSHVQTLQQFSIDEAFIDITNSDIPKDSTSYDIYTQYIQQQIYKHTQIPVSFGVAPTKLLAKIFASLDKPYGIHTALSTEEIYRSLENLAITKIPFLGKKRAKKLPWCKTIVDFMETKQTTIKKVMGMHGLKLRQELHQVSCTRFQKRTYPQSISRRKSFHPYFTKDKELLRSRLINNIEKAYEELIENNCKTQLIKVSLKTRGFEKQKKRTKLAQATNNKKTIIQTAKKLFEQCYQPNISYRTTAIGFGNIQPQYHHCPSIFRQEEHAQNHKELSLVVQSINKKYGQRLVQSASGQFLKKREKKLTQLDAS